MKKTVMAAACIGLTLATSQAFAATDRTLIAGEWKTQCRYFDFDFESLQCKAYIENNESYFSISKRGEKIDIFYEAKQSEEESDEWVAEISSLVMKVDNGELLDVISSGENLSGGTYSNYLSVTLDASSKTSRNMIAEARRGRFLRFEAKIDHFFYKKAYVEVSMNGFDEAWGVVEETVENQ